MTAAIIVAVAAASFRPALATEPLSDNDISWLFPAPKTAADLSKVIAVSDLVATNQGQSVTLWPQPAFQAFLKLAEGASSVPEAGAQIGLPSDAHVMTAWVITGIRIDPGAPGLSHEIIDQFGQLPQVRLILSPVTLGPNGSLTIHDYAAHLIFDFTSGVMPEASPGCTPRLTPDLSTFKGVIADVAALRDSLEYGRFGTKVTTAGLPLGVHPGLSNGTTAPAVLAAMKGFLLKHLAEARLDAMAVVGIPSNRPEPWIFLSMANDPTHGGWIPVPGPTLDGMRFAMALNSPGTPNRVVPIPVTNNGVLSTCLSNATRTPLPVGERHGISTAMLFAKNPVAPEELKAVTATIADPVRSSFFNTDCVSCHTETTMSQPGDIHGIDPAVLAKGAWRVRNFGWSPSSEGGGPTVTRRAEQETKAVADYINANMLPP